MLQAKCAQLRRVWVDERFILPDQMADGVEVVRVRPSVVGRLRADAEIARRAKPDDTLLCLGNLPPIHQPSCRTVVFLQNRYLIDNMYIEALPLLARIRLMLERAWLRVFFTHAQLYLVQTPSMKLKILEHLGLGEEVVRVIPFLPDNQEWSRWSDRDVLPPAKDMRPFLYVASGEQHKNHVVLIEAWILLASQGLYPALQLTLDQTRYVALSQWIAKQNDRYKLRIEIDATQGTRKVGNLYVHARALIFPSRLESFGLPLIEARQAGLPILAAELDYVRDLVDPEEVFDPTSARSIARAVKRFMCMPESQILTLDAAGFLRSVGWPS
jgi:glycosyltransferase involved in cell wall biosynthesis